MKKNRILMSFKPVFAENIISGRKKVEFRKRFSTSTPPGTILLIYSGSPTKAIVGHCRIEKVEKMKLSKLWQISVANGEDDYAAFSRYFEGLDEGIAIFLEDVTKYDDSMYLSDLKPPINHPPMSYLYV